MDTAESDVDSDFEITDLVATDPLTSCTRTYIMLEKLRATERNIPLLSSDHADQTRLKISALEDMLDIQLRNLHVKIAIENMRGLGEPRQEQALIAAINAADAERGPFQPGTEAYEQLLNTVKRSACRREIEEIKADRVKLTARLLERDDNLEVWSKRLKDIERSELSKRYHLARQNPFPTVFRLKADERDPRSPRPLRRVHRGLKHFPDKGKERASDDRISTRSFSNLEDILSKKQDTSGPNTVKPRPRPRETPTSDSKMVYEYHAF